jgi:hypothetical protein
MTPELELPPVPEQLLVPISALVRSAALLGQFVAEMAEGASLETVASSEDWCLLDLADRVIRRWAEHVGIDV